MWQSVDHQMTDGTPAMTAEWYSSGLLEGRLKKHICSSTDGKTGDEECSPFQGCTIVHMMKMTR